MIRGALLAVVLAGCAAQTGAVVTHEEEKHLDRCFSTGKLCSDSPKPMYRQMCEERARLRYASLEDDSHRRDWLERKGCPAPGRTYTGDYTHHAR